MKTKLPRFLLFALVFLSGCAPSVEELSAFVGKTEAELRLQVGSPTMISYLETGLPPKEYEPGSPRWEAWVENQTDHVLTYGNVEVEVNARDTILRVHEVKGD